MKNLVYIEKKMGILRSELKLIIDDDTTGITLTSGKVSKEKALGLKIFQWKLIQQIIDKANSAKKIKQEFENHYNSLCPVCKKGFEKQERACENDMYNFVAAWMLKKSLVE